MAKKVNTKQTQKGGEGKTENKVEEVKAVEVKTEEVKTEEIKTAEPVVVDKVETVEVKTEEVKTEEVKVDAKPEEQVGGKESKKRTFKIKLEDEKFCSRITGNTPKQAASKALTLLINQRKSQGKQVKGKVIFTIKETTRGSKGKEYSYQGEKIKLKQPTTYQIKSANGEVKEIVNKFKNVIEKYQA